MKNFLSSLSNIIHKRYTFPLEERFKLVFKAFSRREQHIFFAAFGVLTLTTVIMLMNVSRHYTVQVPAFGGTFVEGMLGTPTHINPLLAHSELGLEVDRSLTALIYSGLLRESEQGFIPDLAERYEISEDGLSYTFFLREGLTWHDGNSITADDVVFTLKLAIDSRVKSPERANWDGVVVEKVDDLTVRFTLKGSYAPFLKNATLGILPEHIWAGVDLARFDASKYNREPIGSGPYKLTSIKTRTHDGERIPVSYTLSAFKNFALGKPHIKTFKAFFYKTEDEVETALIRGDIQAVSGISPARARVLTEKGYSVEHPSLPHTFAVFFNQNQNTLFADSAVRKALSLTVDKQIIIDRVLATYGVPLNSPIPPGSKGYTEGAPELPRSERLAQAQEILTKAGWGLNEESNTWEKKSGSNTTELRFSLSTSDAPELKAVAEELRVSWEAFGIPVEVRVFGIGDLKEGVLRPRRFDALLFGQVLGHDGDPYAFWHSSQRLDPGLNIASYTNATVDRILERARTELDSAQRAIMYENFSKEVVTDNPAIFLYAPETRYVVPKAVKGMNFSSVSMPADRFLHIHTWYMTTDNVWTIFNQ